MTDDLVGRLRVGDYYPDGDIGYHEISPGKVDALCEQAADRIEALTAALVEIRTCTTEHGGAAKALRIIEEALEKQP